MDNKYILYTEKLSKHYKSCKAVDDVNIHIRKGDIYGFIGKNGAGKSTCLKMFSGLIHPTSGTINLLGNKNQDLYKNNIFSKVGCLIESPGLYKNMTAFQNLKILSLCIGNNSSDYINEVLEIVDLTHAAHRKVKGFSLGMKQRLGIALALLNKPELLILDEPINGLDPQGIVEIRQLILKLNTEYKMTVIISSHILEELAKIATNIGIIHKGKLLSEFTKEEFEQNNTSNIELNVDNIKKATILLDNLQDIKYTISENEIIKIPQQGKSTGDLVTMLVQNGIKINYVNEKSTTLEEYYLNLTSK